MRLFFANGGGPCYIVSVGSYADDFSAEKLSGGINPLLKEQEPTMIVVPEAVNLSNPQECYDIQTAVLKHCGMNMNRVAILDIYGGYKDRKDPSGDVVTNFRMAIGTEFLDYSAAYYPWLHTSVLADNELSFSNIDSDSISAFKDVLLGSSPRLDTYINAIQSTPAGSDDITHKVLFKQSGAYASIVKAMVEQVNLLPPSAAMAGIYTLTDHTKEVWKAPANTGLANVISTAVNISYAEQEDLNVPLDGKAINAIRYFTGEGIKVWGARTLDGNSLDWRYINVRRTMIMLEESIKNAAKAFVFDPNVANTWVIVRSTISNFLNGIWKRGGLAGAVPEDAFSVHVGLGDTMTPEDVLEGIMRITVLVAISRPAEFIEITFMQQMQKS
jgi:phage tail sheath protein FI